MASPDHAATTAKRALSFLRGVVIGPPEALVVAAKAQRDGDAALDALVAALAQAEHERDEARRCRSRYAEERAERAERERDQAIEALREIEAMDRWAVPPFGAIAVARDVLANIEKNA